MSSWQRQNGRAGGFTIKGLFIDHRSVILTERYLELAGVEDDIIADDYSLTRVGREPVREMVMARLAQIPMFAENNEKALNMLASRYV